MVMEPSSKRIVVTGVSRGLGRAMVGGFVDRGHAVFGCARSEGPIEELRQRWGAPSAFEVVDVSRDEDVWAWADRVLVGGPPDLLVNNAGVINANAPLWQVSEGDFSRVIDVNVKGVVNVIRRFLPAMIARGEGVVVN
ncbi:MAG: SDR family NAD(P)-dependent oxidoreductase, partial [Planctomycetia bacterium]|nr:SDR family NAD(P)-dependent oxidoreductase [Planctomycetia bacterium]